MKTEEKAKKIRRKKHQRRQYQVVESFYELVFSGTSILLFLSLFQWYQRADTRLEDIAAQNGWDCLGAADRLATHLKRGTYDYMTIDAIARFDETAQHAQQPTWGQLGEVLVELENEIAFTAIPPREMQKITAYLNGLTGPPTSEEVLEISTIIRLNTYDAYLEARE